MEIVTPANVVLGNEKAYDYMEVNLPLDKPGMGMRRIRIIRVNRDGKLAEFREDMGPAKKFKGSRQLNIPSLFEHTVDELRGLADDLRYELPQERIDVLELAGVLRKGNENIKLA